MQVKIKCYEYKTYLWFQYTNSYIKHLRGRERRKPKFVIFCSLAAIMSLIKTKGALGIRGHIMLYVLIGLLVSESFSHAAHNPEEDATYLKLRLNSLKERYKHLCNQYSDLAANCSAPGHSVLNCSECPDGWFQVEDQCFLLITDRQDWLTSQINCRVRGGHLAILTTREQHEAVEKEGKRIGGIYTYYWIGLTDFENEGEWKWVNNSTLQTSLYWSVVNSEPDNNLSGGEEGEDCAVVNSYSQTWNDVPCSFLYPRICQKEATPLH
ncbi:C-type lectin domain family 4 member D isoform X2 [Xiphias gladius]|uniref:C-type lectin domain family 4 member D isoform X2 n=1 Tax=Xiphias gladius TaxID=8245 RepID=UPI001A9892F2|nr:C-type lectin domain family 4 member D isoform X2 [Xiphias gladius]